MIGKQSKRIQTYTAVIAVVLGIMTFIFGSGIVPKYNEAKEIKQENLLELAEEYYSASDYRALARVYSSSELKNNKDALLNIGVMYAEGIYFKPNADMAKKYLYRALEQGEKYYSIQYLMALLDTNDDREEIERLFNIGCKNNNRYCEKCLQFFYQKPQKETTTFFGRLQYSNRL